MDGIITKVYLSANLITRYSFLPSFPRRLGASLIIIKGHRHLHECAYIGDDSSEESDEMEEAEAERLRKEVSRSLVMSIHN